MLLALCAFMLTGLPLHAAAMVPPIVKLDDPSKLMLQVNIWTDALAKQPSFKRWKTADTSFVPLGPGTHSWLVTFTVQRKPIGYMIVHAKNDDGYTLGEYGVGEHPAFDAAVMYNALIRQGLMQSYAEIAKKPLRLERLYVSPVLAAWKWTAGSGEIYYLDAWTGEALPVSEKSWIKQADADQFAAARLTSQSAGAASPVLNRLSAVHASAAFDPYERLPWLTDKPLAQEKVNRLPELLGHDGQIRFIAELFQSTVLYVFPAVGYHKWNGQSLFVAFDQTFEGTRYIPLQTLNQTGRFYS